MSKTLREVALIAANPYRDSSDRLDDWKDKVKAAADEALSIPERPTVTVATIVHRDGKLLLSKRLGDVAQGTYACPGGHMEFGESFELCGQRELLEETGLICNAWRTIGVEDATYETMTGAKQYVVVFLQALKFKGEVNNPESSKHGEWKWIPIEDLFDVKVPLITSLQKLIRWYNPKQLRSILHVHG